ncbi:MAG: PIG-L deacetylase family protein [Dissulfurispiraceae bacterium]
MDRFKELPSRMKWAHIQRFYEMLQPYLKASPIKLNRPFAGRVLVLSPHIDDDLIGCGGTLSKHVEAGNPVMALYFADCTEDRIKEARAAATIVGFDQLEFLNYKSKTLLDHKDIGERLSATISSYKPDMVYLPSLFDRHADHIAVNHYLSEASRKYGYKFTVNAYEVWNTLVPNVIVDISSCIDKKKDAIKCYKSQLVSNDWVDGAISLNRYRGVSSGVGKYAEAFMSYSSKEYRIIWERIYAS